MRFCNLSPRQGLVCPCHSQNFVSWFLLMIMLIMGSGAAWADTYEWSHDGQKTTLTVTAAKGAEAASSYTGYTISYGGETYTSAIKMESATTLTFTTMKKANITVGVALKDKNTYSKAENTALSITTGTNAPVTANTGITESTTGATTENGLEVTFNDVPAGTQVIKRAGSEEGVFYIKVEEIPETYTVTFNAGTNGACSTTEITETSEGAGVALPKATVNDGFKFVGWSTNSIPTSADAGVANATYKPSSDCTLYAFYTELLPATITATGGGTYNVNDVVTLTGSATATNSGRIGGVTDFNSGKEYRWSTCNADGSNIKWIAYETNATYTPSTATAGTYYYKFMCVENVDNKSGYKSTYSDVITVNVNGTDPELTPSETNVDVEIENNKQITLSSLSNGAYTAVSSAPTKLTATVVGNTVTLAPASKATGQVTVTIRQAASGIYNAAETTITVNVVKHSMAAPTITCDNNIVTITPAIGGATIYYSTDGNNPTEDEAHKYTAPFTITQNCTVKAFATANDYNNSPIASQDVTFVPVVDPTRVGAEDNSSPYNSVHSEVYTLAAGKTCHIEFVNHSNKAENWFNWILSVASTNELATTTPDIMILRADNWDNLNRDGYQNSTFASAFDWGTFKNEMDGATVVMDVTNSGKHIYVNATITTTLHNYKYSAICNDRTVAGTDAHFCFTVDHSHITGLNVGTPTQAYKLTYTTKELGASSGDYGTVTLKNAQGLALRNGTYAPTGEVITYTAEAKTDYKFYQWENGTKTAQCNQTVSTTTVNPCALMLGRPGISVHENIVTVSHPYAEATLYFTTDKSDPATSPTRYQYPQDVIAIRPGATKVRAVAYIDGLYSEVRGAEPAYEHVVVLEARGAAIPVSGTFTDGVSETSKAFNYHPSDKFDATNGPFISPNSDEPNGDRTDVYMTKADDEPHGTYTIGMNSSSATKIVIGAGSNSTSSTRSLTSIYVDGVKVTGYSATGESGFNTTIGRIVINGLNIPQGSDVTFNFNARTSIYYYEIFGESNSNMCKKPDIVPTTHDDTNNIWNYTIKNLEPGSTLHYVIVDLNAAEDARIKGSGESTSDIDLTYANGLSDGYMIRAWSTKDGWAQSSRSYSYVESILSPVLKYNVKEAHYNKDGGAGYTTEIPVLSVYPSAQLANVTFTTDDNTVGYGTDGQSGITIGTGQGLTTIKANLVVPVDNDGGLKPGTYSTSLKLVVSDGIAYALSENEKGTKPKIRTNIEIRDPQTNDLLLTMMYGGYKYKNGQFNGEQKEDKNHVMQDVFDSWGAVEVFSGYGDALVDSKKYVDGYSYNSQATQDARSEAMALDMAKGGHKAWYEEGTAKVGGGTYSKYERIKPFSLPVRGAYFTFEPQENGVLTLYVLQNGSLNTSKKKVDGVDKDFVTGLSATPRTYYWFDQDGYRIEPTSVTVKQPLTFGTDATDINGSSDWQSQIGVWKALPEYTNHESFESELNSWGDQVAVNTNLEKSEPDPQPIMHYQNGYSILQKAYVKYVVNVVAGKTYYFFSNNSKLGFAGVNFKKSTVPNVTVSSSNLTLTQNDNVASKVKPSQKTVYETATLARTFKKDTWNTITLPFALSEKQIEKTFGYGTKVVLFNGTTGTDDCLKVYFIEHVDQNILAGQPYFIQPTGVDINGEDLPSVRDNTIGANEGNIITFHNVCVDPYLALQTYGNNSHSGSDRHDFDFVGTFSPQQVNKYDYYMNATTGDLTQYVGNGTTMNTYRAYLKYYDDDPSTPRMAKVIASVNFNTIFEDIDDEHVTGIMNVLVNEMDIELKPQDGVFNLNGQKVAESTSGLPRGLYIVNGKKIFIK